jgi:hypothetical protein
VVVASVVVVVVASVVVVVVASVVVVSPVVGGLVVGFPVVDVPCDVVPVVPVPGPVVAVPPARVVRVVPPGTSTSLPVPVSMMRAGAGAGAGAGRMLSPVPVDDPVVAGWCGGILAGDVRADAARWVGSAAASLAARPSIIRVRPTASITSNTNPPAMAVPTCA